MILADDPTAAAVLAAVPCYPVPLSGRSPAIDALRASLQQSVEDIVAPELAHLHTLDT